MIAKCKALSHGGAMTTATLTEITREFAERIGLAKHQWIGRPADKSRTKSDNRKRGKAPTGVPKTRRSTKPHRHPE